MNHCPVCWETVTTTRDHQTGETNNMGYGFFMIWEKDGREKLLAHRFSAIMAGLPVRSPSEVVLHSCDTPRCVRPDHLQVGSQTDNMQDALRKNRMNMSGLTAPVSLRCKRCGGEYVGPPNSRYCGDACRRTKLRRAS